MIALLDGVETVFENAADSGGLRCVLEISKESGKHVNQRGRVWRNTFSLGYGQLLQRFDVHGPAILRVNMQFRNVPKDKMTSIR